MLNINTHICFFTNFLPCIILSFYSTFFCFTKRTVKSGSQLLSSGLLIIWKMVPWKFVCLLCEKVMFIRGDVNQLKNLFRHKKKKASKLYIPMHERKLILFLVIINKSYVYVLFMLFNLVGKCLTVFFSFILSFIIRQPRISFFLFFLFHLIL